jgi:hypothetical protein
MSLLDTNTAQGTTRDAADCREYPWWILLQDRWR